VKRWSWKSRSRNRFPQVRPAYPTSPSPRATPVEDSRENLWSGGVFPGPESAETRRVTATPARDWLLRLSATTVTAAVAEADFGSTWDECVFGRKVWNNVEEVAASTLHHRVNQPIGTVVSGVRRDFPHLPPPGDVGPADPHLRRFRTANRGGDSVSGRLCVATARMPVCSVPRWADSSLLKHRNLSRWGNPSAAMRNPASRPTSLWWLSVCPLK